MEISKQYLLDDEDIRNESRLATRKLLNNVKEVNAAGKYIICVFGILIVFRLTP